MQCSERLLNLESGGVQDYVYKMPAPSTYPLAHDLALWEKKGNPSMPSLRFIWFSHHRLHNLYGNLFYARKDVPWRRIERRLQLHKYGELWHRQPSQ